MLRTIAQDVNVPLLTRVGLSHYIQGEFNVFVTFLQYIKEEKWQSSYGNPFSQGLHDGGTLSNHIKYQAIGNSFVDVKCRKNHVLAIGFVRSLINTDESVALLLEKTYRSRTNLTYKEAVGCTMADAAAKGVAKVVGHDSEVCKMHSGDKLASSACGLLLRSKDKEPVNPFPEGNELMALIHRTITHFSTTKRHDSLIKLAKQIDNCPQLRLSIPKNSTRISAEHGMFIQLIRMHKPMVLYVQLNDISPPLVDRADWTTIIEWEGVFNITKITTTLSQVENLFSAAFGPVIQMTTMKKLRSGKILLIDNQSITRSPTLKRIEKKVTDFTDTGKTCLTRAIVEGERRWCDSSSEIVTNKHVVISRRELVATLLDIRTLGASHLTSSQRKEAVDLLKLAYLKFATTHKAFVSEQKKLASDKVGDPNPNMEQNEILLQQTKSGNNAPHKKFRYKSGVEMNNAWSDDDNTSVSSSDEEDDTFPSECNNEFDTCFKKWRRYYKVINWYDVFPNFDKGTSPPFDLIDDMPPLDVGPFYMSLLENSHSGKHPNFGFIPLMAISSQYNIGALNAESFCERIISAGNLVMTDGNTLLNDNELEMLILLRINRDFMIFMREKYAHISKQNFKQTIITEEQKNDNNDQLIQ